MRAIIQDKMAITYSDAQAKKIMRDSWPIYKKGWLGSPGEWMRLLPFPIKGGPPKPYLHTPGGALLSSPDGLFGSFGTNFVDLVVLEHCSTKQNFFDKRSRYGVSHSSIMLGLPTSWCNNWMALTHGGQGGTWAHFGELVQRSGNLPPPAWLGPCVHPQVRKGSVDWKFPVRSLMCVYFINERDRNSLRDSGLTLPRHEYVTTHSRLSQITSKGLRDWLRPAMNVQQFL